MFLKWPLFNPYQSVHNTVVLTHICFDDIIAQYELVFCLGCVFSCWIISSSVQDKLVTSGEFDSSSNWSAVRETTAISAPTLFDGVCSPGILDSVLWCIAVTWFVRVSFEPLAILTASSSAVCLTVRWSDILHSALLGCSFATRTHKSILFILATLRIKDAASWCLLFETSQRIDSSTVLQKSTKTMKVIIRVCYCV